MPPWLRMNSSPIASSSPVVMPGAICATCAIVSATRSPAAAIFSISRSLLRMITPAALHLREGVPDLPRDVVDGLLAVDGHQHPLRPIALDDGLRELVVEAQAVRIASGRIVAAAFGCPAPEQALERDLVGHVQQEHDVERLADPVEHRVERLRLRHRAWEPVEDEAVLVAEPRADEVDHQLVGHEIAALEDRLDAPPELGPFGDDGPEHVPGRDVRDPERGRD